MDIYREALRKDEREKGIKKCDSLFDLSATELHNEYCLTIDFYNDDLKLYDLRNYNAMINRRLYKGYHPYMPLDNPDVKTTMALKRALDFYESQDLDQYIDSLRKEFHKKHKEGNLKALSCVQ